MLHPPLVSLAVLAAAVSVATAASGCDGLAEGPEGVVTEVVDGNTVRLDSGIVVRLLGIAAPRPGGPRGQAAEPLATEARAALSAKVAGKTVRLGLDDEETDRYGRMEAQLFIADPDGSWVQQAMVVEGLARAYVTPTSRRCANELMASEAVARQNGVGIWSDPYYSVRDASDPAALAGRDGRYEIIEGNVLGTGETQGRVYIDFGRVWKDDVTATLDRKALALVAATSIDPLSLRGRRVRIRGWLQSHDGPLVELAVPEQIEVLGPNDDFH